MIEIRRRTLLSEGENDDYLQGYSALYPESTWRPFAYVNIIDYMLNSAYKIGVSFADDGKPVTVSGLGGNTIGHRVLYMLNGELKDEQFSYKSSYTFPEGAINRIFLYKYTRALTIAGNHNCVVINADINNEADNSIFLSSNQILIAPEVSRIGIGNNQSKLIEPVGYGGVLDTCHLDLGFYDGNINLNPKWNNWLNLTKVIYRKSNSTIPYHEYRGNIEAPFIGCINIQEFIVEWETEDTIPQFNANWGIPTTAILEVPAGTTQMYIDKGWIFDNIIEY